MPQKSGLPRECVKHIEDVSMLKADMKNTKQDITAIYKKIDEIPERVLMRISEKFDYYKELYRDNMDKIVKLEQRVSDIEKFNQAIRNYWHIVSIVAILAVSFSSWLVDNILTRIFS